MAITLRQETADGATTKGSALTYAELDNNFVHLLRQGSVTVRGDSGTDQTLGEADQDSILQIAGGTDISTTISSDSAGETVLTIDFNGSDSDTTYTFDAETDGSNANLVLTGSDASTDAIQLVAGTGITLSVDSAGAITIDGSSGGMSDLVDDTTPQLGGDLDGQGNTVSDVQLEDYKETVYSLGSSDSPSIDATNGNVQSVTITSGLAIPDISNFDTGATMTLIISGSGDLSDNTTGTIALFANAGTKTITTNGILSIFNDGSNYYCSLATDYTA